MSSVIETVQAQIAVSLDLAAQIAPQSVCVAFSGGLDSTVLLHATAALRERYPELTVRALHVDHALQADSARWASDCADYCKALNVEFQVLPVQVGSSGGPEAAARAARYRALEEALQAGETLMLAQHQDDQAETYLLQLMRGSGTQGLAAMPAVASFGRGKVIRPLLTINQSLLADYAAACGLTWIDDPSNADTRFDRNWLRHKVMPQIQGRWPNAQNAIARSARYAAEASALTDALAEIDAEGVRRGCMLDVEGLLALEPLRQRNLLRFVIRDLGLPVPSETRLREVLRAIAAAGANAQPEIVWTGAFASRYRGQLVVQPEAARVAPDTDPVPVSAAMLSGAEPCVLGGAAGTLTFMPEAAAGISLKSVNQPLDVRFRRGGERIKPAGSAHHRSLKNLFQEAGVVPWIRPAVPLLYSGDELLAVGDLWIADSATARDGEPAIRLDWFSESMKQLGPVQASETAVKTG